MDVAKIIDQLTYSRSLPKAALRIASAHQDEMVPALKDGAAFQPGKGVGA
jgi:hypothetical protein